MCLSDEHGEGKREKRKMTENSSVRATSGAQSSVPARLESELFSHRERDVVEKFI
jgi:hypothetical protein